MTRVSQHEAVETVDAEPREDNKQALGLTIVMPAYNEAESIGNVLRAVQERCEPFLSELVVVDDGSSDGTADAAEAAGATVLTHAYNKGYGSALKTGLKYARTEYVLTMDSDGQHSAESVVDLWEKLRPDDDMLVGNRTKFLHSPLWRMPGKWLLGLMANYLTRRPIPDLNSGLRLMRRAVVLRYIHLCPAGFSFSTTITLAFLSRGYNVRYIPIEVRKRTGSSTVTLRTGMDTIILILRIAALFDPLRIFVPLSIIIATIGVLWGVPYAMALRGVSVGSMLAIVTAIILFSLGIICDQISQLRLERYE